MIKNMNLTKKKNNNIAGLKMLCSLYFFFQQDTFYGSGFPRSGIIMIIAWNRMEQNNIWKTYMMQIQSQPSKVYWFILNNWNISSGFPVKVLFGAYYITKQTVRCQSDNRNYSETITLSWDQMTRIGVLRKHNRSGSWVARSRVTPCGCLLKSGEQYLCMEEEMAAASNPLRHKLIYALLHQTCQNHNKSDVYVFGWIKAYIKHEMCLG